MEKQQVSGTLRLWGAVLEQSMADAVRSAFDAREWFDNRSKDVGSFEWLCDVLNASPDQIRAAVAAATAPDRPPPRSVLVAIRLKDGARFILPAADWLLGVSTTDSYKLAVTQISAGRLRQVANVAQSFGKRDKEAGQ